MIITEKSEIKTGKNSADVKVYFCNVDEDFELVAEHGVRIIPTIVYMENEEVKNRKVGVVKLSELIQITNS